MTNPAVDRGVRILTKDPIRVTPAAHNKAREKGQEPMPNYEPKADSYIPPQRMVPPEVEQEHVTEAAATGSCCLFWLGCNWTVGRFY